MSPEHDIRLLREALGLGGEGFSRYDAHRDRDLRPRLVPCWDSLRRNESEHSREMEAAKCPVCPGTFALRLCPGGDWTLERRAP